jgi:SLT domain-containing protein
MVDALGVGNLERVRHSVLSGHTAGAEGLFAPPPGFAAGGLVGDAVKWARQQQGKPYVWGATGPGAYDCSGLMSAIVGFLTGQPLYTRRFSTASFAGGRDAGGFRRGLRSAFTVGVNPGQHMAGTLGGHNVESSHPGSGPRVDNGAHGSTDRQFPYQYYLPQAGGRFIPGPTGGGGFDLAGYLQRTFAAATKSANQIPGLFGAGNTAASAQRMALDAIAGAKSYATTSAALSLPGSGGGAQRWSGVAARALALLGLPPNWLGSTIRRMQQESGGDPLAVNRTDVNWARGTPSVSLMQVIGPTYRSNVPPQYDTGPYLYGVSVNPLSNILSSMRYTMGRYGSLPAGYDRAGGYRNGGVLPPGGVAFNETTRPEAVLNASQWHDFATAAATPQAGGVTDAQLRMLAQHIADAVNARPTVSVAASPTAGVRELADTVLFTLRHSGKGVHP